ncbi:nuclear pore complex protein NUP98A-like [Syzygium oleosum]|uniref:nuclear pore complex protein NUP98A-like n=1 Tax=Syzygium oleosum TaxID=219896 RepID=UPI0024BB9A9F|nr:nuclear pore complex protein NUP98A-like [Syzygium oleosum]
MQLAILLWVVQHLLAHNQVALYLGELQQEFSGVVFFKLLRSSLLELPLANNANNNPFVGGTTPFGSQPGGPVYGGTSTGVFRGASSQTPSLMSSGAPFGDSSSSAFVGKTTSIIFVPFLAFGQANNATNNPFVGGTTPFGSPTGGSVYGGTSTGVSGGGSSQTPSLMSSGAPFGDSSSSAFVALYMGELQQEFPGVVFLKLIHSCLPELPLANNGNNNPFVGGTTPFGSPTGGSVYGGTSTGVFRGAFPQTPSLMQANNATNNPFVGGTSTFGSPTGGSVYGGTSTGVFRGAFPQTPSLMSSRAAFGNTSIPVLVDFRSQPGGPVFGGTSTGVFRGGFLQSPSIFSAGAAFGNSSSPAFGGFGWSTPTYGTTSTPACVTDSAPSFGATGTPAYGSTMNAAFGTRGIAFGGMRAPVFWSGGAFGSSSNPAFGPSATAFRSNQYGSESHGAHIGPQVATPTFGNAEFGESSFGRQHRGSRVAPFTPTTEAETGVIPLAKLQSICGMTVPVYKYKSHEELRWEDYQWGDKGGPNHAGQSGVSVGPDGVPKDGPLEEQTDFVKASQKLKGVHDDSSLQNDEEYVIINGAGESAIGYDCGAGIETLMPKLCQPDYYTEPHVKELAAKERAEPGFCCRVNDFVVGRLGYGHIKFVGETDVRRLDLESLIRFNNREVIVYIDEGKKPPIGQGLNKPAEVTLLNIKCIDKKTGKQYIEGPKVEKYKEMLKKAAEEQGAEFVSYDPIKGQWKFKVGHFSSYDRTGEQD